MPYGFDFTKAVSRFEEALHVIRLLWESDGPVDFSGSFYKLHQARLDTEPYAGRFPEIWVARQRPPAARHRRALCRRLVAGRRMDV